jgi:hypothetical protein
VSREDHAGARGISIICVYNNSRVREECLDRSIQAYSGELDVDYIPVDNTKQVFNCAGAALNHGVINARHDLVAFVHQDVYLHSIDRLAMAGPAFDDGTWGLLGANGVASNGENIGRLRDRAQLIGRHAPTPVDVDSVDEVLFLVPRQLVVRHPLSEDPHLAWHAYAVEYGLRLRLQGRRVGAVDLAITHNSLTANLARLDVAHRSVGEKYPQLRPIHTTCGTIGERESRWRSASLVRQHGWRMRWLRHSLLAVRARQKINAPVVLSDIRQEVDLLPFSEESPLYIFNLDRAGGFAQFGSDPLRLTRYGRPVVMQAVRTLAELLVMLEDLPRSSRILVVDVTLDDLAELESRDDGRDWLVGIHPETLWLLGGSAAHELPAEWSRPRALPLGVGRHAGRTTL